MDANTEYWQDRLQQLEFDHKIEVERLKARIIELEEKLEAAIKRGDEYRDAHWQM